MLQQELIQRNPMRILEKSIHGGVGIGNIGIFAAQNGVGKTACLVHVATDRLIQNRHVLHITCHSNTDHVKSWYEDIFQELATKNNLENAHHIHDNLITNRTIMNFSPEAENFESIKNSITRLLAQSKINVDLIIIDHFDFTKTNKAQIEELKNLSKSLNAEIWFSLSLNETEFKNLSSYKIPSCLQQFEDDISVIISLEPKEKHIQLKLIKDHNHAPDKEFYLKLDPHTLLIL